MVPIAMNKHADPCRSGKTRNPSEKAADYLPSQSLSIRPPKSIRRTRLNVESVAASQTPEPRKLLCIPLAIDDYNHHMNGADIANQQRRYHTSQRKHTIRAWRPLFHWLLDMMVVNCYIIWREQARKKNDKVRWDPYEFTRALTGSLFTCRQDLSHKPDFASPRKVAGGLRVGIPKTVAETTDLRAVNFARQHHYERGEKRKRCVLCREIGLQKLD
jgi:hypothetical protein